MAIYGKNVEVTEALRDYVNKKVGRVGRYFHDDQRLQAQVTLSVQRGRHIVEVTLPLPQNGLLIRAEEESDDMYASIDLVVDKLERQIRKYKTRLNRKARRLEPAPGAARGAGEPGEDESGDLDELDGRLVRTKRFPIKPMPVEEAILQMNLLGHDFFVFMNASTREVNVVYRRRDGQYGLIEPEY